MKAKAKKMKIKRTSINFIIQDKENKEEVGLRIDKYFDVFLTYNGTEVNVPEVEFFNLLKRHMENK
jgi:hypothetical protein